MPLIEEELEAPDDRFLAIRLSEFYSPRKVAFDLHLKLGSGKYLRVFRAGEDFVEAELKAYESDRGVRHVYFGVEFRPVYIKSSAALLQKIAPLAGVPLRTKFGIARILSELYVQELFRCADEERTGLLEKGKEICAILAAWIEAEPNLLAFLMQLEQTEPSVEAQSFLTGIFSAALSQRFPWKSRRTTENLLLISFCSDLGIAALPPELQKLRPKRMSASQRKLFEKHPELSYLLLEDLGVLKNDVLLVVRQHHEYNDGSGFPHKLTGEKTLMLAKLVCLSGDIMRASSDFLLPPLEAARIIFPELSIKAFTSHPEIVAKYDRDVLTVFFTYIERPEAAAAR